MNSLVIILGIVIIFFIYLLFQYLTNTATTISSSVDFTQSIPTITGSSIAGKTNVSYAYGIWLYIQNWDMNKSKYIFSTSGPGKISLYLDNNKPILYCNIATSPAGTPIIITNNFPLQKWVYIIVSVDNQYVDCYLDGKLVKSQQLSVNPPVPNVEKIYLGNTDPVVTPGSFTAGSPDNVGSGWSANALIFTRWTTPVDPQTAWKWYMKGNGKSKFASLFGAYGVNYSILKDNVSIVNNQPLF